VRRGLGSFFENGCAGRKPSATAIVKENGAANAPRALLRLLAEPWASRHRTAWQTCGASHRV
jgi:hypothetical protein